MKESGQSNIGTFCYQIGTSGASPLSQVSADCGPLAPLIVTSAIRPKRTK
jgi:hypothetical protein